MVLQSCDLGVCKAPASSSTYDKLIIIIYYTEWAPKKVYVFPYTLNRYFAKFELWNPYLLIRFLLKSVLW